MGKTVDERVVEMRFDNRNFESNVKTSMSTIDKLKRSLKFEGATKGLENLEASSKKVSLHGLSSGIDAVKVKFSALQVMGTTALANITNSAMNAGKNIVSAFTIDPVKSGLSEYETQLNAVQTILANTSSKGTTIDQVNDALNTLNTYADKTIYNFTEMTRNIGTFTAAGVDLDTSVKAIQGIANLAAVSGSNSQQASTAMYQLSQALATGTVKLMDWNSVVNAGMGGEVFQNALKRTSKILGTGADAAIKAEGSFRESLKSGWLTSEVLTTTLDQFTMLDTEANRAKLAGMGYAKEQIDEILKMGTTATDAATKVKTFSQLMDTLKEATQSGWTQTWQLILGNFDQAKTLFTEASDFFGGVISKSADARNSLLTGALTNVVSSEDWDKLVNAGQATKGFQKALIDTARAHGIAIDEMIKDEGSFKATLKKGWLSLDILKETLKGNSKEITASTDEVSGKLKEFESLAKEVIQGKWGNGSDRVSALTKAGHDYASVQNVVNHMLLGTKLQVEDLSDAELKAMGCTDKQVKSLRELAKTAKETGTPLNELMKKLERPTGRELLIDTVRNSIKSIASVVNSLKGAWRDIFPATTSEQVYKVIEAIHALSSGVMEKCTANADNLRRTFRGLFAVLDIAKTIISGTAGVAFTILKDVLAAFDLNVLDVTANIGDALVAFRDWFKQNDIVAKGLKHVADGVVTVIKKVKEWIDAFKELPLVKTNLGKVKETFADTFEGLPEYLDNGKQRIGEFIDRVKDMDHLSLDNIKKALIDFKDNVLGYFFNFGDRFKDLKASFSDLRSGIEDSLSGANDNISNFMSGILGFGDKLKSALKKVDFGSILTVGVGVGMIAAMRKIAKVFEQFTTPIVSLSNFLDDAGGKLLKTIGAVTKNLKASALQKKSVALLNLAKSLLIMATALLIISKIDEKRLWSSVGAIGALGAILLALTGVAGKLGGKLKNAVSAGSIVALSLALLVMINALKQLQKIDPKNMQKNIIYLGELFAGLVAACFILSRGGTGLQKGAGTILAFSVSLLILVKALKQLDAINLQNGVATVGLLAAMMIGLGVVVKLTKGMSAKSGLGILAVAVSLLIIVKAFKQLSEMPFGAIMKGLIALIGVFTVFKLLVKIVGGVGADASKAGLMFLGLSAAILLLAVACKKLARIDGRDLAKAITAISAIMVVFSLVMAASKLAGKNAAKAGAMIMGMCAGLLALSVAMAILSKLDPDGLDRAVGAVAKVIACFAGLIVATKLAKDCKANLIVMSVAIGILAIALGTLSLIKPEQLKSATNALCKVIAMFGLLIASTKFAKKATSTLVVLTAAVVAIGTMLAIVGQLPNGKALQAATALSEVMLAMSASLLIISKSGGISKKALISIGVMTLVMGAVAGILILMSQMDVKASLTNATAISELLLALSGACLMLSIAGNGALAAIKGAAALDAVIVIIGGLVVAIGALFEKFGNLEGDFQTGLQILEMLGYGIGKFLGNILGGFSAGVMSGLPEIGTFMTQFMQNAQGFFDGTGKLDSNVTDSAKKLAEVVLILTGSQLVNAISSAIFGDKSMDKFGEQLSSFGRAIKDFSNIVTEDGGIDGAAVKSAANAGKALTSFATSIPNSGGWLGGIVGENDIDDFSAKLTSFASAIVDFSNILTSNGGIDGAMVKTAANAGKTITSFADSIPESGGWAGTILGDNDVDVFSSKICSFARAIVDFSNILTQNGGIDSKSVKTAVSAGKLLSGLQNSLPATGGVLQDWTGEKDLADFGIKLCMFGRAIADFSNIVTLNGINQESVDAAVKAGQTLLGLENALPKTGGVVQAWTGQKDLSDFGSRLFTFGQAIAGFSNVVSGNLDTESVTAATNAGLMLAALENSLGKSGGVVQWWSGKKDIGDFGNGLVVFGQAMCRFSDSIAGVNAYQLQAVSGGLNSIISMIQAISTINGQSFVDNFSAISSTSIAKFVDEYTKSSGLVYNAVNTFLQNGLNATNVQVPKFAEAGQNAVKGFINAIWSKVNDGSIYGAGYAIGNTALKAAKEALDIHSPSKKMYKVGSFAIDGFINAIKKGTKKVTDVSTEMMTGFVTQATKMATVSTFAKGAISQYAKSYTSKTKSVEKQTKSATKALSQYVKKLYMESDAYKQDKANLKQHNKELKAAYAERAAIVKKMAKTPKLTEVKSKTTTKANSTYASLEKQLKDADKKIDTAKKQLVKDGEEVAKNAKKVLTELKKSIKDSVTSYIDVINLGTDTGINLFEEVTDSAKAMKKEAHNAIVSLVKDYGNLLSVAHDSGISLFDEFNANGAEQQKADAIASAESEVAYAKQNTTDATAELANAQTELANAQAKSNAVNGRSQKLLDAVAEASEKVAEAQKKVTEATNAQTAAESALSSAKADTDVSDLLKNMESQVKGIEDLEASYIELGKKGINEGLIKHLKDLGTSGVDQVKTFLKMSKEEVDKANEYYTKSIQLDGASLINNFKDKVAEMSKWSSNMKLFSNLGLSSDVKTDLLKQFQEKGVESNEYIQAILAMTEDQLKDFNETYKTYLKTPEEVAKSVEKTTSKYVDAESKKADTSVKDTLDTMQANLDVYENWQKQLKKLSKTNVSDALFSYLKGLGVDGAKEVETFAKMTAKEMKKANKLFKESGKQSADQLLSEFGDKLNDAKTWGENVKKLSKLNLDAKVKEALLKEVQDKGIDSSDMISTILGMDSTQLAKYNSDYKKLLSIPTTVANEVIAAQAKVNSDVEKKATEGADKAKSTVTKATDAATDDAKKGGKKVGTELAKAITSGLKTGVTAGAITVKTATSAMGESALTAIKVHLSKTKGKDVGKNVTDGIVVGLNGNSNAVITAAETVASKALSAAKKKLGIHSPSKEFAKVGMYSDLGIVDGLLKYSKNVKDASSDVGNVALNAMSDSISKISRLTNDNMDAQPTIRPVLDLSDVKNGITTMNGMFGTDTVSVNSKGIASSISNRMRSKDSQNGVSGDNSYDNSTVTFQNTFYVNGENASDMANDIARRLQHQVKRKDAQWA